MKELGDENDEMYISFSLPFKAIAINIVKAKNNRFNVRGSQCILYINDSSNCDDAIYVPLANCYNLQPTIIFLIIDMAVFARAFRPHRGSINR